MNARDNTHLDTQIVSYALADKWDAPIHGATISSIVANEFLQVQSADPAKANWYLPSYSRGHSCEKFPVDVRRRDHPFQKWMTDSIVMDFGNEFPSIIEFNNFAVSRAINQSDIDVVVAATNHLHKSIRKRILKRFRFLVDNRLKCLPVQKPDVEHAFELLLEFRSKQNLKENFRNSWNDLLILSCARNGAAQLVTEDNELSRFAGQLDGASCTYRDDSVEIQFAQSDAAAPRKPNLDSKGYINVGWRVQFKRTQKSAASST